MSINPKLQELTETGILICVVCRAKLKANSGRNGLECEGCQRLYPIRDGIPVLIAGEAIVAPTASSELPAA